MNNFPYDVYYMDSYSLAYHAVARYKQILMSENLSEDLIGVIEDDIIPAMEYILAESN